MSRKKTNKIEAEGQEIIQTNAPFKIVKGGYAKPLGNGFYLLGGKKHEQGGIDLDLKGDTRVWSSVPFLNGESPAEKVLKGENPNAVFARQENYKERNKLNDDGTKKAKYGLLEKKLIKSTLFSYAFILLIDPVISAIESLFG